ncbi:MAG: WD40 repeat domain-containing protein [Candidatus Poribacteria bacterium]|nr:WD40 repeat domain-containing protein [Candidatus Poribacteria bacterium]
MSRLYTFFSILVFSFVPILTNFAQDNTQVGLPEGAIARLGKGGINVMQFSPNGEHLAVGTSIGVWVYDVEDRNETALFPRYTEESNVIAFSPDGKKLASGGYNNSVILMWDLETGNKLSTFTLPQKISGVSALVFSENNKTLFSIGKSGHITEWDIETGRDISKKQFNNSKSVVAFAKDGKTFVTGDAIACKIRLGDTVDGSLGNVFKVKSNLSLGNTVSKLLGGNPKNKEVKKGVETLAISPDNKTIASAHDDNMIRLWDTSTKTERISLKGHTEIINTVAFSPDSKILASGSADRIIMLWDAKEGRHLATLSGHKNNINALMFSPTEKGLLASGSADGTVRFWNTNDGKEQSIFTIDYTASVKALAFSTNNTMLCSAGYDGVVQIWHVETGKELPSPSVPHFDAINALAFSQDATLFACNGVDTIISSEGTTATARSKSHKEIRLSILPTGDKLISFPQETSALAFSPDNKILAAGTHRQSISLFDINSGTELFNIKMKEPFGKRLVFSPNGKLLAIHGTFVQTQLWDVVEQRKITLPNIQNSDGLAFSPDSSLLALKYRGGIDLWRVTPTSIEKYREITRNSRRGFGNILMFSPDGKTIIDVQQYNGRKSLIQFWDVDTGNDLGNVSGHAKWIETLAFSHDGKILASGAADGTVLLWDWEKTISKAKENKGN